MRSSRRTVRHTLRQMQVLKVSPVLMEEMPEDFPPRIMFDNIEATKANTDEILTLLKEEALATTGAQ